MEESYMYPGGIIYEEDSENIGHLQVRREKERRNSISSLGSMLGAFTNHSRSGARNSVPNISLFTTDIDRIRQSSSGSNSKTFGKLYQYIRGGEQNDQSLYKLDDAFALVRSQLDSLSEENRTVRSRVHSLTEAVDELSSHYSTNPAASLQPEEAGDDICLTISCPEDGIDDTIMVPPLPAVAMLGRSYSHPPLLSNGWHETEEEEEERSDDEEDDGQTMDWMQTAEIFGMNNARVPCIIMVGNHDDESSEEEEPVTQLRNQIERGKLNDSDRIIY